MKCKSREQQIVSFFPAAYSYSSAFELEFKQLFCPESDKPEQWERTGLHRHVAVIRVKSTSGPCTIFSSDPFLTLHLSRPLLVPCWNGLSLRSLQQLWSIPPTPTCPSNLLSHCGDKTILKKANSVNCSGLKSLGSSFVLQISFIFLLLSFNSFLPPHANTSISFISKQITDMRNIF